MNTGTVGGVPGIGVWRPPQSCTNLTLVSRRVTLGGRLDADEFSDSDTSLSIRSVGAPKALAGLGHSPAIASNCAAHPIEPAAGLGRQFVRAVRLSRSTTDPKVRPDISRADDRRKLLISGPHGRAARRLDRLGPINSTRVRFGSVQIHCHLAVAARSRLFAHFDPRSCNACRRPAASGTPSARWFITPAGVRVEGCG